jgi:hypothetical protein
LAVATHIQSQHKANPGPQEWLAKLAQQDSRATQAQLEIKAIKD